MHTKCLRRIVCVRKSTNLAGLYGELGRVPLILIRKVNMLRYWLNYYAKMTSAYQNRYTTI